VNFALTGTARALASVEPGGARRAASRARDTRPFAPLWRASVELAPARASARSLEAIALDNVSEGCVRELYGALVATYQARVARDPEVRAVVTRIAREETQHAALSLRSSAGSNVASTHRRWRA
jgi:demethoxyubiquinone hydroxylase (CLK1/Coq7/Cat5 family)